MLVEEEEGLDGGADVSEEGSVPEDHVADEGVGFRSPGDAHLLAGEVCLEMAQGVCLAGEAVDAPQPVVDEGAGAGVDLENLRVGAGGERGEDIYSGGLPRRRAAAVVSAWRMI